MTDEDQYRAARDRAASARVQFLGALSVARTRLAPARLKADAQARAVGAVRDAGNRAQAAVKRHPIAASGAIAALFAWFFRRRIGTLSRQMFVSGRERYRARRVSAQHSEDEG